MSVSVRIPTTLRTSPAVSPRCRSKAPCVTVLASLDGAHPGFADRLLDDEGNLRRFVNVFVADDDIRFLDGLDTPFPDGERCRSSPRSARRLPATAGALAPERGCVSTRRLRVLSCVLTGWHSRSTSANPVPNGGTHGMPKIIAFDTEARRSLEAGMNKLADAVRSRSGPRAATSCSTRSGAPPRSPTTACRSPRRSSSRTPTRRSGPSWSRRSPRRPTT